MPVSARSSVVLPWSMCPAVPMTTVTRARPASDRPMRPASASSSAGRRSAGRAARRRPRSARPRPGPPARGALAARSGRGRAEPKSHDGSVWPGRAPPPTVERVSTARRRRRRAHGRRDAAPRAREAAAGARLPPHGDVACAPAGAVEASVAAIAASVALSGRIARASGSRRSRVTRAARADDEAGLRAAHELVSREGHEVGSCRQPLLGMGSCASPKRAVSRVPLSRGRRRGPRRGGAPGRRARPGRATRRSPSGEVRVVDAKDERRPDRRPAAPRSRPRLSDSSSRPRRGVPRPGG